MKRTWVQRFRDASRVGLVSSIAACMGQVPAVHSDGPQLSEIERVDRIRAMYEDYRKAFPDVPEVTPEQLMSGEVAERGKAVVLVDVREDAERAVSMLPGAVTLEEVEREPERFEGQLLVTYCTIGYRSGIRAQELRERGLDSANLAGSILAWTHAGGELQTKEGATRRVHVYGEKWNLVADGYEAVW